MSTLQGRHVLISAGPTYEDIDPVRFVGNRSSGKMGFAIAAAAAAMGAKVTLIAGPVHLPTPAGVTRTDVRSAAQMHAAVMAALPADVYIGAAAVADFTPVQVAEQKLKKTPGSQHMTIELVRTADILADVAACAGRPRLVIGFAAETRDVLAYAQEKRLRKQVDMICANDVAQPGQGFEADANTLLVISASGVQQLGPAPKSAIAEQLLHLIDKASPDAA